MYGGVVLSNDLQRTEEMSNPAPCGGYSPAAGTEPDIFVIEVRASRIKRSVSRTPSLREPRGLMVGRAVGLLSTGIQIGAYPTGLLYYVAESSPLAGVFCIRQRTTCLTGAADSAIARRRPSRGCKFWESLNGRIGQAG